METTTTKTENKMIETFKMLKEKHSDALILFRVGDFYEAYCEDAQKASEVLGVTLTKNKKEDIFIASFPEQALDTYLPKLIRAGIRVAICDCIDNEQKVVEEVKADAPQVEDADAEEIKTDDTEPKQEESKTDKWAHIYYPNGDFQETQPKNGTTFELEEMQEIVGGYIEVIRLNDGRIIIVNEEGLLQGLPVNIEATNILRRDHSTTQYIVGNAIVCDADMVD